MNMIRLSIMGAIISLILGSFSYASPNNTVLAQNFLGQSWMESSIHNVAPNAQNDGIVNTYIVKTQHGIFHVKGTDQTHAFIREIIASHNLKNNSTVGIVGSALKDRVVNLVKTPIRVVKLVGDRIDTVSNVQTAILLAPKTVYDVGEGVFNGAGEMIYTGNRLIKSVGEGSNCQGFGNCLSNAGGDIFSGINSVVGKHGSSRRLHAKFGTDSETRNPILKREVDRLAYAESYTMTGLRLFAPDIGLSEFDTYRDGVGFYNGGELVTEYKDAYRERNVQQAGLEARGIQPDVIKSFYKNDLFTNKQKFALIESLNQLAPNTELSPFIEDANMATNFYDAKSYVDRYGYLANLKNTRGIQGFKDSAAKTLGPVAMTDDGYHVMPVKADYLDWTVQMDKTISRLASLRKSEIHVLGHASPELKQRARGRGVRVVEIR